MFYIIKYNLEKGEGKFPTKEDVLAVFPESNYRDVLKSHLRFSFNNDNNLLPVTDWKLVDDGLKSLPRILAGIEKGPKPTIWLKLEEEVDIEDKDAWVDALSSDYVLSIPGINDDEPFYFQDHNGYSKIESAEWLADDLWETMQEIVSGIDNGQTFEHNSGISFKRELVKEEDYIVSLTFNFDGIDFTYKWMFETESAIDDFDYCNNEYVDSEKCNFPEENPKVLKIHTMFCENED